MMKGRGHAQSKDEAGLMGVSIKAQKLRFIKPHDERLIMGVFRDNALLNLLPNLLKIQPPPSELRKFSNLVVRILLFGTSAT